MANRGAKKCLSEGTRKEKVGYKIVLAVKFLRRKNRRGRREFEGFKRQAVALNKYS